MLKIEMKIKFFVLVNTWTSGSSLLYSTDLWWYWKLRGFEHDSVREVTPSVLVPVTRI